jgi:hypothetical protein
MFAWEKLIVEFKSDKHEFPLSLGFQNSGGSRRMARQLPRLALHS